MMQSDRPPPVMANFSQRCRQSSDSRYTFAVRRRTPAAIEVSNMQ
jgi:hypothetical protein